MPSEMSTTPLSARVRGIETVQADATEEEVAGGWRWRRICRRPSPFASPRMKEPSHPDETCLLLSVALWKP